MNLKETEITQTNTDAFTSNCLALIHGGQGVSVNFQIDVRN